MELQLKAKHLHQSKGFWTNECAIGVLAKEYFNLEKHPMMGALYITTPTAIYLMNESYGENKYQEDMTKARSLDPETIIRTIQLIEHIQ